MKRAINRPLLKPRDHQQHASRWCAAVDALVASESETVRAKYVPGFEELLDSSHDVFFVFEKFTLEAYNAGMLRFGTSMVWNRMRWYTEVEMKAGSFKLNNNYCTFYGRLLMRLYPELEGFFKTREMEAHDSSTFTD